MSRVYAAGIVLSLALLSASEAEAGNYLGSVRGTNTVDFVLSNPIRMEGETVDFSVAAFGNGNNKLIVKVQQQRRGGGWRTIGEIFVAPESVSEGSFTVRDFFDSEFENVRYRISRKIGTRAIDYLLCD